VLALLSVFAHPSFSLAQTFEITGGETVFSQNSQYYFGEVGDFFPLGGVPAPSPGGPSAPDVGTAPTGGLTLHLFVVVFYFSYETPGPPMTTLNSYNGLNPGAGIRVPLKNGFWEGDVGIALAQAFQTDTPVESLAGVYLQTEYYQASVREPSTSLPTISGTSSTSTARHGICLLSLKHHTKP